MNTLDQLVSSLKRNPTLAPVLLTVLEQLDHARAQLEDASRPEPFSTFEPCLIQAIRGFSSQVHARLLKDKPITLHPCGGLSCEGKELGATFIEGSPALYIFARLDEEGAPVEVNGRDPGVPLPNFVNSKVGPIDPADQKTPTLTQ